MNVKEPSLFLDVKDSSLSAMIVCSILIKLSLLDI